MRRPIPLALAAGAVLPLAYAPFGLWPLAVVSPAALVLVLVRLPPGRAALAGWSYGLGMFGFGVWWIQVSVHQFGLPHYAFSVGVTAVFVAGMALYPALFAWLAVRLPAPGRMVRVLVLAPSLWVLTELLRAHFLTGFPWLALGYSQIDAPLAGFAPLVGVHGCSVLVFWLGAAFVAAAEAGWRARVALAGAAALLVSGAAALRAIDWTEPAGAPLTAVLVQGAVPQAIKWKRELREPTLRLYEALSEPHWDADVIVWPETAVPAFPDEVAPTLAALGARARRTGTDLLIGMPTGSPGRGRYYNSVVELGMHPGRYDKRHLVPFGEFFPFQGFVRDLSLLLDIPLSDFSPGAAEQDLLRVGGYPAGVTICYEDAFPGEVARALPGAAVLVNVSNDAWFGDTIAPHQHLEIARMRALETGRYLLRGTNTGITAIIDARGRVTARSPQFVEYALRGSFEPRRGSTPYTRLGDGPLVGLLLALVGALAWAARIRLVQSPG